MPTISKTSIVTAIAASAAAWVMLSPAQSASLNCASLNGDWAGTISGKFRGKITMTLKNCKMTWTLPDRRKNFCSLKSKDGGVRYRCSLGSHGTVKISGSRMTLRNTFTGNDYVVKVSKK